ncbi:MAG: hypothetical protein HGA80_01465 [Candidatus Omnitrophica bacterium]|nr:hypothetical protein [Candidatus Omnitrophota bacterium]
MKCSGHVWNEHRRFEGDGKIEIIFQCESCALVRVETYLLDEAHEISLGKVVDVGV